MNWAELRQKRWFKNLLFLIIILFISFSGFPLWVNIWFTQNDLDNPSFELVGEYGDPIDLSQLSLVDRNGELVDLTYLSGKPVFLNFWQSWCVPCLAEFESLEELKAKMPEVEFLFISAEPEDGFLKYVNRVNEDLPYYRLSSGIPKPLNHRTIPTSFLINREGVVVFRHYAAADWSRDETANELNFLIK